MASPGAATHPPPHSNEGDNQDQGELSGFQPKVSKFELDYLIERLTRFLQTFQPAASPTNVIEGNSGSQSAIEGTTTPEDKKTYMRQVEVLIKDLQCIETHWERFESHPNRARIDEQLCHLMAAHALPYQDFGHHSFKYLFHVVTEIKVSIPRKPVTELASLVHTKKKKKKKQSPYTSSKEKDKATDEIVEELVKLEIPQWGMAGLLRNYDSLSVSQKLCLLCFSVFPCNLENANGGRMIQKSLVIKKKILVYWWVGEGFIDPDCHDISHPNLKSDSELNQEENPNAHSNQQVLKRTIEEIGEEILNVLAEKGFIELLIQKGRESGSCRMHPFVQSFVAALAKRAGFFDFNKKNGGVASTFNRSQRACLVQFDDKSPSSCQRWALNVESRDKLKRFETVQTLFNVNEPLLHIRLEWFRKMKYLSVLYLGSWRSETTEHVDVLDQKFLEELKMMKQLKLLSLQGMSAIEKLTDSVCKLHNLIILDLRKCHSLEELPADIGSLKNLTHLDLTKCFLLAKLPKGLSLLPKLEVLRGFVINEHASETQDENECFLDRWWKKGKRCVIHDVFRCKNKEICTLRDLLKVQKLRELSIVVNKDEFPNDNDLKVLKEMVGLRKLKISWERSLKDKKKSNVQESLTPSKCSWLTRCCKQQKKNIRREELDQIEKLELLCCPFKKAPGWLVPGQLKKLERLYIKGGQLVELHGGSGRWEVKTLRFKCLPELEMTWGELQLRFPKMTYVEKYKCNKLSLFPCDEEGVWRKEDELPRESNAIL